MSDTDDSKMKMVNGSASKGSPALRPEFQAVVQGFETITKKTDPALYQVQEELAHAVDLFNFVVRAIFTFHMDRAHYAPCKLTFL
jgi:hypothetical protein